MKTTYAPLKIATLLLALLALTACDRKDETIGQKVDGAINKTTEAAKEAKTEVTASVEKSMEKTAEATKEGTAKATEVFEDAAITTSVTAGIAKDPDLSAFKIDISTKNGRVSMHGSAPTEAARDRAVSIAQSVKGVLNVDNQLSIKPKG